MTAYLEVLDAGALTTVQDEGRPGFAHLGVPRSGALDAYSAALANRLVGNPADAAVLETTATGCIVRASSPMLVSVTGALSPVFVGAVPAPFGSPVRLAAGQVLEVGAPARGLRSYVAVRGGIAVPPVLGSRSTDTLSGLGPAPVSRGDRLPVGESQAVSDAEFAGLRVERHRVGGQDSGIVALSIRLGPRDDWFTAAAIDTLTRATFEVSADSNRVGLRLAGPALERAVTGEIPSEGMVLGAVQVPPSGEPVVFLADHPTTGGYPVIGVVDPRTLAAVAQARAGDRVQFSVVSH